VAPAAPDPASPKPAAPDYGSNALAASLTFAVAVALFTLLGWWLDSNIGTTPIFLVLGFLVGAAGGMLHLLARLAPSALPWNRRRDQQPPRGTK
jgi:F0F1-type ATP synthase assembly protein I